MTCFHRSLHQLAIILDIAAQARFNSDERLASAAKNVLDARSPKHTIDGESAQRFMPEHVLGKFPRDDVSGRAARGLMNSDKATDMFHVAKLGIDTDTSLQLDLPKIIRTMISHFKQPPIWIRLKTKVILLNSGHR